MVNAHVGQIHQIDHDLEVGHLDHLDPNLPLLDAVQDLSNSHLSIQTLATCPGSCRPYGLLPGHDLARLHRPGTHPPSLADLDYDCLLYTSDAADE